MSSDESCAKWRNSAKSEVFPEDYEFVPEKKDETPEPKLAAYYNGRQLKISEEFLTQCLSGISIKHYNGNCLPPEESMQSVEYLAGEDYAFVDYDKPPSRAMSSMIRVCYEPRSRRDGSESDEMTDTLNFPEMPFCVQEKINYRNTFWDLHRPDLCKLTWPYVYVGEATVIQHLHKHLRKHGNICSQFHRPRDMTAMLDKELDYYDTLKIIQPPQELPPDDEILPRSSKVARKPRKKVDPCKRVIKPVIQRFTITEEDLEPSQLLHESKEEFCITIGRPIKKRTAHREPKVESVENMRQIWVQQQQQEEEFEGELECWYEYPEFCSYSSEVEECEEEPEMDESTEEEEVAIRDVKPVAWVEPDYCAMI